MDDMEFAPKTTSFPKSFLSQWLVGQETKKFPRILVELKQLGISHAVSYRGLKQFCIHEFLLEKKTTQTNMFLVAKVDD